ncbi:transglutaminase-like domain-containing protein [Aporhodopirellula aestuarii]|uniref:Transglutaminase-like domain-containing protein n=1 Tax=Aporhodopirellula aestuarii TaxID=2950107 RepID=A0ABT0U2V9_9BACT|nr:transglutaminase-like domain-containing protein [Aporhodopirellula aestuarii]MCM2371190.1 transglutaminase-like domain-containing protein [Aporhodopirellula aestuarii]
MKDGSMMTEKIRLSLPRCFVGKAVWGLVAGLLLVGCDVPDRHDIEMFRKPAVWEVAAPQERSDEVRIEKTSLLPPSAEPSPARENWQFWYLHHVEPDGVIGGGMMQSQRTTSDQIKLTLNERTLIKMRGGKDTSPDAPWRPNAHACLNANEQTFWHSSEGQLLRTECRVRRGPLQTTKFIELSGDTIRFDVDHLTSRAKKNVPHQGPLGGPLAVYQSLLGNPLRSRERREATVLLPIQETLAALLIRGRSDALAKRMTDQGLVLDSLHEAVAVVSIADGRQRERYYWYDDEGVVQATNITGESRFTYRCDEAQYAELGEAFLENVYPITIQLPGKPIPPGNVKQLAINVDLSPQPDDVGGNAEPASAPERLRLPVAPRQYVQSLDAGHQRVITAAQPVSAKKLAGRFEIFESPSRAADTAATPIVDYRSAGVRKMLAVATSMTGMSNQEKAIELNRTVHSLLSFEPLSVGIRPAGAVAEANIADSTEHAILLIAMLRARGVPARMALGMRHLSGQAASETDSAETDAEAEQPSSRFVYHAWVIAKTEDDWISLDPTTGSETSADCIALKIDDLSDLDAKTFVDQYLAILASLRMTVSAALVQ